MPWSAIVAPLAGAAATSLFSPDTSPQGGGVGSSGAASAADPFGSQRGTYQTLLAQMMTPGGFTPDDPSYKWRFDQGMDAVNRGTAAGGGVNSGGRLQALEAYGSGMASTEFQNQFTRLAQLSGATSGSPGTAGQILAGQQAGQQANASAAGNTIGKAVAGWGQQLATGMGGAGGSAQPAPWQPADPSFNQPGDFQFPGSYA